MLNLCMCYIITLCTLNCMSVEKLTDLVVEGHSSDGSEHPTHVPGSHWISQKEKRDRDDDDPLGSTGNRIRDWGYSGDHAKGYYVLAK